MRGAVPALLAPSARSHSPCAGLARRSACGRRALRDANVSTVAEHASEESEECFSAAQVVEALPLPAALKLVSACCGKDLKETDKEALQVSQLLYTYSQPKPMFISCAAQ